MKRHLYQRTIDHTDKGDPVKAWYFWYRCPETGKQIRRSCGTSKKPVLSKREAELVIEKMEEQDRHNMALRGEAVSIPIAKLAEAMFRDDSDYLKRRRDDGYLKEDETLKEVRRYVNKYIVKKYGHLKPEEIDPVIVDSDLINYVDDYGRPRSGSWRNRIVSILNWILDEAVWLKMIKIKPILKEYKRNIKTKSILSQEEIKKLFPDDFDDLSKIWAYKNVESNDGFMFGTLFALMASTGIRNGEIRGINPSQLVLTNGQKIAKMVGDDGREAVAPLGETEGKIVYGLVVDRMFNQADKIVPHLKKGNDEKNRKIRLTIIPNKTVRYLKHWLSIRPLEGRPDLLFAFQGRRIRCAYIIDRLGLGLKNAKIDMGNGRIIRPHSLRYTYNTKMRRRIPDEQLRPMMGHDFIGMTDYYTIINLMELNDQFLDNFDSSTAIDRFWGE